MDFRHAFGAGDVTCVAIVPGRAYVLDEVTNFSISSHFDKIPIRRLGHALGRGWATGSGTVAGTLVCAQLTRGALWKLRRHAGAVRVFQDIAYAGMSVPQEDLAARFSSYAAAILPQQLPPFHLMFVHQNESGQMGLSRLYYVMISDYGEITGTDNSYTEATLQYQALHYEQLQLSKSLTTNQLATLANKPIGFFNDPRRTESLFDSIENLLDPGAGTLGYDADDLTKYLVDETRIMKDRIESGSQVTSFGIADVGDVVYVDLSEGKEMGHLAKANIAQLDTSGTSESILDKKTDAAITEILPVRNQKGALVQATMPAFICIRGLRVHMLLRTSNTNPPAVFIDDPVASMSSVAESPYVMRIPFETYVTKLVPAPLVPFPLPDILITMTSGGNVSREGANVIKTPLTTISRDDTENVIGKYELTGDAGAKEEYYLTKQGDNWTITAQIYQNNKLYEGSITSTVKSPATIEVTNPITFDKAIVKINFIERKTTTSPATIEVLLKRSPVRSEKGHLVMESEALIGRNTPASINHIAVYSGDYKGFPIKVTYNETSEAYKVEFVGQTVEFENLTTPAKSIIGSSDLKCKLIRESATNVSFEISLAKRTIS